jgi:hypothetical protein
VTFGEAVFRISIFHWGDDGLLKVFSSAWDWK